MMRNLATLEFCVFFNKICNWLKVKEWLQNSEKRLRESEKYEKSGIAFWRPKRLNLINGNEINKTAFKRMGRIVQVNINQNEEEKTMKKSKKHKEESRMGCFGRYKIQTGCMRKNSNSESESEGEPETAAPPIPQPPPNNQQNESGGFLSLFWNIFR